MRTCNYKHHVGDRLLGDVEFTVHWNCCRLCLSLIRKREREKNKERVRKEQQEWRTQHKKHLTEYNKQYMQSSDGKKIRNASYERNREQKREYDNKRWRTDLTNRIRRVANGAKYRAAKLRATPRWFDQEKKQIEDLYLHAAQLTASTGIPHEVDHVIPLQGKEVSGLHTFCNLQIITEKQNQSKKNKLLS